MRKKKKHGFKSAILKLAILLTLTFVGWKVITHVIGTEVDNQSVITEISQHESGVHLEVESEELDDSTAVIEESQNHLSLINLTEFYTGFNRFKETGFFPMFLYNNYPAEINELQGVNQINVPLLNQQDFRWAFSKYGDDSGNIIAANGCAVVSLAMIDSFFKDEKVDPAEISDWAGLDHYVTDVGTAFTIYSDFAKNRGYQIKEFYDFDEAMKEVQAGHPVVVAINPGYFSPVGHVMVIRGYEEGQVYINDPNDNMASDASSTGHDEAFMIEDAIAYWSFSEK